MSDLDLLEEQRDELAHLIEQLKGPSLADSPSLRLLVDSLRERREKLDQKLAASRRTELRVRLQGDLDALPTDVAAGLLAALASSIRAAVADQLTDLPMPAVDETARMALAAVEQQDEGTTLTLASPPRRASEQLLGTDGEPVLAAALGSVCDALEHRRGDLLTALADVLVETPVSVTISAEGPGIDRSVEVERGALQAVAGDA